MAINFHHSSTLQRPKEQGPAESASWPGCQVHAGAIEQDEANWGTG